jgi:hypothetical protein
MGEGGRRDGEICDTGFHAGDAARLGLRPTVPVDLPEKTPVEFEPRVCETSTNDHEVMSEIYEVLSRRFRGGSNDVDERHDEHQS